LFRWLNLLCLDVIRARNKPKAPPKKPKAAPFFLPTIPGLEERYVDLLLGDVTLPLSF
jgi:U3 small nucleolar RNA-associated protein 21